ncbi:MAG TPA: NADH-quinone oxidoreductase subunit C [Ohtaekwangia sp.]|nr:NADH-quinone oxidoreductase subunit C [Ohtaekwangia sp.]
MFDIIVKIVKEASVHGEPETDELAFPKAIRIKAVDLLAVCNALYKNPEVYFDMLSCVTGIDNGPQTGTMEVAYNLYSIPFDLHLMLKVTVPRDEAKVESVSGIWRSADWHEREIFDMFGVHFNNHPDLRRILMPADWEGHPLRKDYKQQAYYRNIKLDY